MKIVDLDEFLTYPDGIIFQKFYSYDCDFGEINIKRDSITTNKDFFYSELFSIDWSGVKNSNKYQLIYNHLREKTDAVDLLSFDTMSRDGCFEDKQLFAVWNKEEIQQLQNLIGLSL